jgi:hypothetical protein
MYARKLEFECGVRPETMEQNAEPSTAEAEIARLLECRNLAGGGWHWKYATNLS